MSLDRLKHVASDTASSPGQAPASQRVPLNNRISSTTAAPFEQHGHGIYRLKTPASEGAALRAPHADRGTIRVVMGWCSSNALGMPFGNRAPLGRPGCSRAGVASGAAGEVEVGLVCSHTPCVACEQDLRAPTLSSTIHARYPGHRNRWRQGLIKFTRCPVEHSHR